MHIGRNINRLRNFKGIKQADIAKRLKMTQQNYSLLENSETVSDDILKRVAEILEYDTDFIKELPEMPFVYSNNNTASGNLTVVNYEFNPLEKIIQLYERMLQTEREKNATLESMLKMKGSKKTVRTPKK